MISINMNLTSQMLIRDFISNPVLEPYPFEEVEYAGFDVVISRKVPYKKATALWRAARAKAGDDYWPLLTQDDIIHEYSETVIPPPPMSLELVRAARKRSVRASEELNTAFRGIDTATPLEEPYAERDAFIEDPAGQVSAVKPISLIVFPLPMLDALAPFSTNGVGSTPTAGQLLTMLRHFQRQYGAEPIYADSDMWELEIKHPPQGIEPLRAAARDMFLISRGRREGYGIEDPARLLRRLMNRRWVLWWYGTY